MGLLDAIKEFFSSVFSIFKSKKDISSEESQDARIFEPYLSPFPREEKEVREVRSEIISPDEIPVTVEKRFYIKLLILLGVIIIGVFLIINFISTLFSKKCEFVVYSYIKNLYCNESICKLNIDLKFIPKEKSVDILNIYNFESLGCKYCKIVNIKYNRDSLFLTLLFIVNRTSFIDTFDFLYRIEYKLWFFTKSDIIKSNITFNISLPALKIDDYRISEYKTPIYKIYNYTLKVSLNSFTNTIYELPLMYYCNSSIVEIQAPKKLKISSSRPLILNFIVKVPTYIPITKIINCKIYYKLVSNKILLFNTNVTINTTKKTKEIKYKVKLVGNKLYVMSNLPINLHEIKIYLNNISLPLSISSILKAKGGGVNYNSSLPYFCYFEFNRSMLIKDYIIRYNLTLPVLKIVTPYFNKSIILSGYYTTVNFSSFIFNTTANITLYYKLFCFGNIYIGINISKIKLEIIGKPPVSENNNIYEIYKGEKVIDIFIPCNTQATIDYSFNITNIALLDKLAELNYTILVNITFIETVISKLGRTEREQSFSTLYSLPA